MVKRGRVVHRRPADAGGRRRESRRRDSVSGDDDDKEYVVVDDESESTDESLVASSDDENFEINASDDDFDDDEDEDDDFAPRRPKNCNGRLRKNRKVASDDDYEEEEELKPSPIPKRKPTARSRRRKFSASEADEDFNPDEDEVDEEVVTVVKKSLKKKSNSKSRWQPPKKRRRKAPKQKKKVKRRRAIPTPRSDDDDFVAEDIISGSVNTIRKNRGTNVKKRNVRRKRSAAYSDGEDSDFVVDSEDEYEEEKNNTRTRNSNTNGKRSEVGDSEPEFEDSESEFDSFISDEDVRELDVPRKKVQQRAMTNRRSRGLVADSDSSDFDYEISEEELRDLKIPMPDAPKPLQLPKRSVIKGKEKEEEDLGKHVCGICLSEEQKTTLQGMLDCCSHYYCFQCIIEWSKVESRCPVCKRRFSTISKWGRADPGFELRKQIINIPKRDQVYQPSEEEMRGYIDPYENVVCIVCQQGGDDSLMLLCDICDSSAHTHCVGLGREVPEGNWYCEACRSADDGLSHTQVHDITSEQVSNTNDSLFAGFDTEDLSLPIRSPAGLGCHFPHGLDLNAPPRDCLEEDLISTPLQQPSGAGASTLSGRRAIHQRIRFILSSQVDRSREIVSTSNENGINNNLLAEPGVEPSYPALRNASHAMNSLPVGHSRLRLSPCMYRENGNFRHVDGAKEHVQSKVKYYLRKLSKDIRTDYQAFKDIARCSTHTILAACGIKHRKEKVVGPVQSLDVCHHSRKDGPVYLPVGCCSSCFDSFIEGVVSRIINT